jgi:hypothetical protein
MLKYLIAAGALVLAGVPAAVGLAGNDSFSRDVPVRVPQQAQTVDPSPASTDDDGTADQGPGDVEPSDVEPGDDNGGLVPRDDRTEAGDDRDADGDDPAGHDAGDDHGDDGPGHDVGDDSTDDNSGSGSTSSGSGSGGDSSGSGSDDGGSGSSGGGSDDGSGHD